MALFFDQREDELEALEQYRKGVQPAPIVYKADGLKLDTKPGEPMVFIASEESADRAGDIISAAGWQLENFRKNPVFLYMHDREILPLGTWNHVRVEKKQLLASPTWDEEDEFATKVKGKYERGVMRAVSVGFRVHEFETLPRSETAPDPGVLFTKQELLEISAVIMPAHPNSVRRTLGKRSYMWVPVELLAETVIGAPASQMKIIQPKKEATAEPETEALVWNDVMMAIAHIKGGSHV